MLCTVQYTFRPAPAELLQTRPTQPEWRSKINVCPVVTARRDIHTPEKKEMTQAEGKTPLLLPNQRAREWPIQKRHEKDAG